MYVQHNSPFAKKGDAPSRKKSKGYYNKAKDTGTGAAAATAGFNASSQPAYDEACESQPIQSTGPDSGSLSEEEEIAPIQSMSNVCA